MQGRAAGISDRVVAPSFITKLESFSKISSGTFAHVSVPEIFQKQLSHARGYLELDVPDEAWKVLDEIDPQFQQEAEVLNLRLRILVAASKWCEAVDMGRMVCKKKPDDEIAFILTAQCLYELKRIQEAKSTLLSGPDSLRDTALFHYNLGCYSAELGETSEALDSIKNAIGMDKLLQKVALKDPSLQSMKHEIQKL